MKKILRPVALILYVFFAWLERASGKLIGVIIFNLGPVLKFFLKPPLSLIITILSFIAKISGPLARALDRAYHFSKDQKDEYEEIPPDAENKHDNVIPVNTHTALKNGDFSTGSDPR